MPAPTHFFVRADTVYPADRARPLRRGYVEVREGTIASVGSADEVQPWQDRPDVPVVDYGAATVLPGMIDAHCHLTLTGDGKTYEEQVLDPDEMMSLIAVSNMRRHLASGVTTIRDNGGRNRVVFVVREAIRRGYVNGPRMLLAGRPLTHDYGHFYWCNGVADSDAEIRAAVRRLVAEGADHIKIMASGGATAGNMPHYPSYTTDEMRVAVQTAHGLGRTTTAHARAAQSIVNAVDAGSDCVEHAEFLVPAPIREFGPGVASAGTMVYDPAITERLHEAGTFVSFTIQTGGWETLGELTAKRERGEHTPEDASRIRALEAYFDMKLGIFSKLLADDMVDKLAISSDAGPYDVSFGGLQNGLVLAVRGGMSPAQALDAVTSVAAQACGIADQVGSLHAGKVADLLVVKGDATADINATWDVQAVYQSGRIVAPIVASSGVDSAPVRHEAAATAFTIDC
jgi:imidazolonepropionase-like amidohydrolase